MAYKELIAYKCICGKIAKYEVKNCYNLSYGKYCTKCADALVAKLKKEE